MKWFQKNNTKTEDRARVYLDYAAATPVRKEVLDAMLPYFCEYFWNPSSIHAEGVVAHEALMRAREEVARLLGVRSDGVTFTSGGTEANNLGILGSIEIRHQMGIPYGAMEVISTAIEHPSITRTLTELGKRGVVIRTVPVTEEGLIEVPALTALLSTKTVLVTYAYVNSEIGVVQHVRDIARCIKKHNEATGMGVHHHLDACQAPLWLPCSVEQLGVDSLSLDAGKCYGPKGVGALITKHGHVPANQLYGGDQEGGRRPGTENLPSIIGFATALAHSVGMHKTRSEQVRELRDDCIRAIRESVPGAVVNGSLKDRVANNINISFPGVESEFLVIMLDHEGFAVSTRSACSGKKAGGSEVVYALSGDITRATSTLRITLGEETTKKELTHFVSVLTYCVKKNLAARADFKMTT